MHKGKICEKAKLNSLSLKKNLLYSKHYSSSIKDESKLNITMVKRQIKNNDKITWLDNKMLSIIRKEVFRQQMELIDLANVYGLHSNALFKKQELMFNSLFFRIMAIDKLSKFSSSWTSGVDKIKLLNNKKNKDLYIKLLELIRLKVKYPNSYKASPVKKVWILKKNSKLRPLRIPLKIKHYNI